MKVLILLTWADYPISSCPFLLSQKFLFGTTLAFIARILFFLFPQLSLVIQTITTNKNQKLMNRFCLLLFIFCIVLTSTAWAQLKLNIKQIPNSTDWGVYVQPCDDVMPSSNTITGSAQVTVVVPVGNDIENIASHHGHWAENATVSGPDESPTKNYISIGFITDSPQIVYEVGNETLLFSFEMTGAVVDDPELIENDLDPFAVFPNSVNSNPGNEISVLDIGASPIGYYYYSGNYVEGEDNNCTTVIDTTIINPQDSTMNDDPTATVEEIMDKIVFSLAPNPTSEWITVKFNIHAANKEGTIRLWTASGISIGQLEKSKQSDMTLNVGGLAQRIIFYQL